ncbi:DUF4253 domain-containing protein [Paenibacillus sp. R14(2021)]|uniref:DUF4253 domain-containing protein n=1 Tax=Paenibacillus sp. R14(2021) TaxID=2859228 RepID=UPI001C613570|nr:DUF4253 domain-containing protein [Paenibacillus sp. R14(2021)]
MTNRYKLLPLVILLLAISGCGRSEAKLTETERSIAAAAGINEQAALEMKQFARKETIQRLKASEYAYDPKQEFDGITVELSEDKADKAIQAFIDKPVQGLLLFRSERNYGIDADELTLIKSEDQYDILRSRGTDGANYDILNADVISKLQEWEKAYLFRITGAGHDWVEAKFTGKHHQLAKLADEVYAFCPDVVDQGTETVSALRWEMETSGTLYLWWD